MSQAEPQVHKIGIVKRMPEPLPDTLTAVPEFDYELLPESLRARVRDISERMQCPPDYVAVGMIVGLSSLVGRRVGVAPKESDDWTVIPNLWGAVVGRPGVLKSPALHEVMKPLRHLQANASEVHARDKNDFEAERLVHEESEKIAKAAIRKFLIKGAKNLAAETAREHESFETYKPVCRRYVVNDSTVEKLGEILKENPMGILLFRDELAGFFRNLEKMGREGDRAFYLECWNGDGSFTYDRIGRGTLHIPAACISILGGIQPGPLSEIVRRAGGAADDGLLQRFQLLVYPNPSRSWKNIDRRPDQDAKAQVEEVITRLDRIDAMRVDADEGEIPILRFEPTAQALFNEWREVLEHRLRDGSEHPLMEAHLAKYRSLVPSLALVLHLTVADEGPISYEALERGIAWAEFLEPHARRVFAPGISPDLTAAHAIAARIEAGDIEKSFTARDVYRRGWSGLSTRDAVVAGLKVLEDFYWVYSQKTETGGKPRYDYIVNEAIQCEATK